MPMNERVSGWAGQFAQWAPLSYELAHGKAMLNKEFAALAEHAMSVNEDAALTTEFSPDAPAGFRHTRSFSGARRSCSPTLWSARSINFCWARSSSGTSCSST